MTAPPAKIKAFLEEVKKELLDVEDEKDFQTYFLTLLSLEILQRGVIVTSAKDASCVLASVTSVAGKALLDTSAAAPKPLLAGSSVVAGRIAERACQAYTSSSSDLKASDIQTAMTRCKEVQEGRLQALLQILQVRPENEQENDIKTRLFYIAEGYYYRAGTFQPDAPPMWKKTWDVITERNQIKDKGLLQDPTLSWEAVTALTNLRRIALAKGNVKRATELCLRLAESALDATVDTSNKNSEHDMILKSFVAPFRTVEPYSPGKAAELAEEALDNIQGTALAPDDVFAKVLLDLRLANVQEAAAMEAAAQETHRLATNRSDGKKVPSMDSFRAGARREYLASTADNDPLREKAVTLRDTLLNVSTNKEERVSSLRERQAAFLLRDFVASRLQDRAQAVALSGGNVWAFIAEFVEPILKMFSARFSWDPASNDEKLVSVHLNSLSEEEKSMMEAVSSIFPCVDWMQCGTVSVSIEGRDMRLLVESILSSLYQEVAAVEQEFQEQRKKDSVVSSSVGTHKKKMNALSLHLVSSEALLALEEIEDDKRLRRFIESTLVRVAQDDGEISDRMVLTGVGFLEFLVCWGGILHAPWSFCTLPEARSIIRRARATLNCAGKSWGRRTSVLEECLLDIGEGDAEGPSFGGGGLVKTSKFCYTRALQNSELLPNGVLKGLLVAKCRAGLARNPSDDPSKDPETLAREALELVISLGPAIKNQSLYLWRSNAAWEQSIGFHVAAFRQLVADILIRNDQEEEAQKLLEDAVKDAPSDASAAFTLGAYRLRVMFFGSGSPADIVKAAQIQLLKAAKLDSNRAAPFALLGYWYEKMKDNKRAVGCYSKALQIDPCQPVAGRGLIRLAKAESLKSVLMKAITESSPLAGWAWRTMARQKAFADGNDNLAVVSFLKALRCRDIERPEEEPLAVFFGSPFSPRLPCRDEISSVLADLAACYRRMGRYTAAIWSFHSSIKEGGDRVPAAVFCSCAQVELELGLFDGAAENFSKAIERADENLRTGATYGRGVALLAMAQRDNKDGKCGSAYDLASKAIEGCESLKENKAGAIWKLLGDLYTFGASLPVDVFESDESIGRIALQEIQLAFVANGEDAYTRADQVIQDGPDSDDNIVLRASFVTDLGVNKLLQAQMLGAFESEGLAERSTRVNTMFEKAADEFRRALELCPVYAPAWCGLGCSVAAGDPLLAQHAFCRSIDLDHQFPDAYCNLSFLYTQRSSFSHSASVSDAVTQIADTPMMWINRALILEHESVTRKPEESADHLRQAADAYRAALQVEKDPSAMFGLALTCHFDKSLSADSAALESYGYTTEYLGGTNSADLAASVLNGIFSMRLGTTGPSQAERIAKGGEQVRDGLDRIRGISAPSEAATNFNVDLIESILRPASSEGPDDGDADTTAHPDWKNLSLCRKIIHEPQRGDLWLALAKELAMEKGSISEAKRAIHRALSILNHQREKFSRTRVQNSVDARDLSDAYAISYWLEQCLPSATEENESSSASKEEKEEGPTNVVSTLDLQRALLICPNNALARAALLKQTAA